MKPETKLPQVCRKYSTRKSVWQAQRKERSGNEAWDAAWGAFRGNFNKFLLPLREKQCTGGVTCGLHFSVRDFRSLGSG